MASYGFVKATVTKSNVFDDVILKTAYVSVAALVICIRFNALLNYSASLRVPPVLGYVAPELGKAK